MREYWSQAAFTCGLGPPVPGPVPPPVLLTVSVRFVHGEQREDASSPPLTQPWTLTVTVEFLAMSLNYQVWRRCGPLSWSVVLAETSNCGPDLPFTTTRRL